MPRYTLKNPPPPVFTAIKDASGNLHLLNGPPLALFPVFPLHPDPTADDAKEFIIALPTGLHIYLKFTGADCSEWTRNEQRMMINLATQYMPMYKLHVLMPNQNRNNGNRTLETVS